MHLIIITVNQRSQGSPEVLHHHEFSGSHGYHTDDRDNSVRIRVSVMTRVRFSFSDVNL